MNENCVSTYGSDLFTTHRKVTDVNRSVHVICKRPCVFDGGIANVQSDADVIKKIKKYAFLFDKEKKKDPLNFTEKFIYQI
jgi:hypothetical protein